MSRPLGGVFVGGAATRMGGAAKGLLPSAEGEGAIVVRTVTLLRDLGLDVVLVGVDRRYDDVVPGVPQIADAGEGLGPVGGLLALLEAAKDRTALSLACDMPFIRREDVTRLLSFEPASAVVAARASAGAPWEPFFARYAAPAVLPAARAYVAEGGRSLQRLLSSFGASPMIVADARTLVDWDSPDDMK